MSLGRRIPVAVPGAFYDVEIGSGLLADVPERIAALTPSRRCALVTDEHVASIVGARLDSALASAGFDVAAFTVAAGEASKRWTVAGDLVEGFASAKLGRDDFVIALGGGVIGDLAGFAAAVYLRGVDFVQVPTTLLAMVDSSVGGKTAVDLTAGKNLAGAFKQPKGVFADTEVLASLPLSEWRSGIAEAAKSAVLDGEEFLGWLEQNAEKVEAKDDEAVSELVARCVSFKSKVVARDQHEEGPRECLNYGHTLGHAAEKVAGYGSLTHGAAVAEGMRFAARVAVEVAGADPAFVRRQDRLLDRLGLAPVAPRLDPGEVLDAMRGDKKVRGGTVRMVLATAPGEWRCEPVEDSTIRAHLDAWAATKEEKER